MTPRNLTVLVLIYAIWISLFAPFAAINVAAQRRAVQNMNDGSAEKGEKGLQFRISESSPQIEKREVKKFVAGEKLNQTETDSILKRLPQVQAQVDDKADFKLRADSLPPPKTGNIINTKFPANENQPAPNVTNANSKTLEISRFSPDGNVAIVSDLSVTFSQPMIAVTSQTQAAQNVPVQLTPNVKGQWRWLGTKTLIFDAATRFPMATRYTATIPAGTKSAVGGTLQKEVSWTFSTPPPRVENFNLTGQTVKPDALMFASFDQEIDANAALSKISVTAKNQKIALRLANENEIASNETISNTIKTLQPRRFIAFRAVNLLPQDSEIKVSFDKGFPSAEGSLTTTEAQIFPFKTYGALKFIKSNCNYGEDNDECAPDNAFQLEFNNTIDATSFDKSLVKIEPNGDDFKVNVYGNEINIEGYKTPRTTYKVTVSRNLKDEFGQTLGQDVSATFKIGTVEASLNAQGENFITLDPNAKLNFSVYSVNQPSLRVKLYQVAPTDFSAFQKSLPGYYQGGNKPIAPNFGKLVSDKSIQTKSNADEISETRIDLNPALRNGFGNAILIVEPTIKKAKSDYEDRTIIKWIQATQIGVDAFVDDDNLTAFATDLKNGKPLSDVQISIANGGNGATNEGGLAEIALPATNDDGLLIARKGEDVAILPENSSYYYSQSSNWYKKTDRDDLRWFVFNDRNIYRPDETVSIKGYIRKITGGKLADIAELGDGANGLNYVLRDSRGNEISKGAANLNAFGAFDFKVKLPANVNLGYQTLELKTNSILETKQFQHSFQVQEFRRPEFEVTANVETPAPFFIGNSAAINVEAKYFSGGFLSSAATNWNLNASPTNYTPPNREDFTFGKFVAWWRNYGGSDYDQNTSQNYKGATGADGKHRIAVDFVSANPARPYTLTANASVQDVNNQTFAANTSLLVHPSEIYVGLRTPKNFVRSGEKFTVETIATDIDGKFAPNREIKINAVLKDYEQIKGEWKQVVVDEQNCAVTSSDKTVSCDFTAKQGGVYTITASVLDDRERRNTSEITLWVAGGKTEPKREVEKETVELIPNKKDYAPNDVAEILVNAPFANGEGVLTLRRNGIVKTERFTMTGTSQVLQIPIEERFLPNVHVQVDIVGASERTNDDGEIDKKLPSRPAFASGELNLSISTASRELKVSAEPQSKTLEPAGTTKVDVTVKDSNGNAVANSEVAVIVVDESVLALTGYNITNPLAAFYQQIEAGTSDFHSRENVLLANPEDTLVGFGSASGGGSAGGNGIGDGATAKAQYSSRMAMPAPTARMKLPARTIYADSLSQSEPPIQVRQNFDALATFAPSVKTDGSGKAVVDVKLPDNLTRYRVTAIAVDASKRFGKGESAITARQPLQIRPSAPRFMNFGDKIELPVVIQNQTDAPMTVNVAIRATNADLTSGNGKKVVVPANDRTEIRFPVSTMKAGTARFQFGATSGKYADAAEIELPILTPATSEAFATYGTTEANGAIVQPITAPTDVYTQFGGLEVTTSSTQLQELTDAFIYLQSYPFECSEQISSRVLSVVALRDVLTAFDAKDLPTKAEIEAKMKADIERLAKLQHQDGGFSFWRSDDESFPYLSVHVANALARAKAKGYNVPQNVLDKSKAYLKNIETKYPKFYSEESRNAISAYALYVRDLMKDTDAPKAKKLLATAGIDKLSLESLGWLMGVLAKDTDTIQLIKTKIQNSATETAGAAHFVTNYTDGEYVLLSSERRADAVILESMLKVDAQNDLIPKIVRGLLANKIKGRWRNTQENVFVLLALDKYFQTYEKVTPNFVAKVWLGNDYAGEQKFVGRSVDSNLTNVPMNYLAQKPTSNLILDKQGEGRLYYRIGLKYAPKSLKLDAADYGFQVLRTYEAIDDAFDVVQNADKTWTIKSGARVRVNLQMVAPTRRYHVALVDNLPAGFEIINTDLANAEAVPNANNNNPNPLMRSSYYNRNWFEHQNLRDNRAEAFTSLLYDGVHNYSYVARATTTGNFVAPPAKAEEMYAPETFGRTATDFINVK